MINILYWNVRELGNIPTRNKLKVLFSRHNVDIVAIAELMIDVANMVSLSNFLNMLGCTSNCDRRGRFGFFGGRG